MTNAYGIRQSLLCKSRGGLLRRTGGEKDDKLEQICGRLTFLKIIKY